LFGDKKQGFDQFDCCACLTSVFISIVFASTPSVQHHQQPVVLPHIKSTRTRHMPPRTSSASPKFIGGSPLQKELQGVAAFVAYAEIHRKGDLITQAMQHTMIGENLYGNPSDPDSIGLVEQLVNGNGVFCGLYVLFFRPDHRQGVFWSIQQAS
jgi:hypothetical protein